MHFKVTPLPASACTVCMHIIRMYIQYVMLGVCNILSIYSQECACEQKYVWACAVSVTYICMSISAAKRAVEL